ncbi:D-2-hydroxyacid dehydrogenase family protein [Modestobacter sp. I12A-02628]|uniref:D-2-hydroxyacid dehydrogenase family protein n=1 Tax=Goekera deserti TaxID=2497753 RepID=A0A7K3WG94_9ACTN|nr:D-2-hydroxyacid dehydrogenase family protein [Goekera deserti]MPQ96512.1 D-2-hydroxyacid dehydrogenase family protein [Goekera deserti]NDI47173.1 D-2-hydroxyacid dehydrogenase family protein [Goekera deserti]NEL55427.1 D-2-hydroxyacid dehydrogenase family protein [Goekera deserti]
MRCAVLDDYQGVALTSADWSPIVDAVEVIVVREHLADEDAVVAALAGVEIVVVMRERTPLTASLIARLPQLRLVVTSGMRNASIDLVAAEQHGVVVCGTRSNSEPPAELTWALILGLARHLAQENATLRASGPWQSTVGTDLYGATLGLLGLGKIGAMVARVGTAFGMDVVAWSQNLTAARAEEVGVRLAPSKEELVAESDVLSVHLVLGDRTRGLIGAAELAAMKPTALLVNTSRAAVVDGAALVTALREGRIAGAGLDVFEVEPLPAQDELRTLPNVLATPHLGYVTRRNYTGYFTEAVQDIAAFLAGTPVRVLT